MHPTDETGRPRHVLVGGDGFTGRHLARRLLERGEPLLIADLVQSASGVYPDAAHQRIDIAEPNSVAGLSLRPDDIVHHLAARQYHGSVPNHDRDAWFGAVNVEGTRNLLEHMARSGCIRMVFYSTDMVYGLPRQLPVSTDHPQEPIGPYGASKKKAEALCLAWRERGFSITILRPRLIVGPGRLGVLAKLFRLIRGGLPVPIIGRGHNHYQMLSVHDCVEADLAAVAAGLPQQAFNLGSADPPRVIDLLRALAAEAGSRSVVVPTPAGLVKSVLRLADACGRPVLFPEQFLIADCEYRLDTEETTRVLGWRPRYGDREMLFAAYREFLSLDGAHDRVAAFV